MAGLEPQLFSPPKPMLVAPVAPTPESQPGVLVVDDDGVLRALLTVALQKSGFTVWQAAGGAEAVQVYQRHRARIGVVLLDVRMPVQDGPHTLAELQRLNPTVACCFMSGYTGDYSVADLLGRGALHLFDKPFRIDEIVGVLGRLAEQHLERQACGS